MPEDEPDPKTDLRYEPDEAALTSWELWLSERPEIEAYARQCPPWNCYRKRGQHAGHYAVESYNPNGTVTLNHGSDSFLPGIQVFGVPVADLEPCGCRRWRWASKEQAEQTIRRIERAREIKASKADLARRKANRAN